ncbi:unnamed protein product, partial [marine sediment metagenome]
KRPNPMPKVAAPRCPKKVMATLEPDEAMRLLNSVSEDSPSKLRDQAIMTLFVDTGIRRGELAQLRPQDIKTETIRVRGKSDELKVVINLKGERGLIGVQSPDCDPKIHTFEGDLTHALESVPGLVEAAKQSWAENPKYPKCETDLTPPAPAPSASRSGTQTGKPAGPQPAMF